MANQYVVGVDVGTTGSNAVTYDVRRTECGQSYCKTGTTCFRPGTRAAPEIIDALDTMRAIGLVPPLRTAMAR